MPLTEADIEQIALEWFAECGYTHVHGPDIAPEMQGAERASFDEVILVGRLRSALGRINPEISSEDIDEVVRKVLRADTPGLVQANRRFHTMLRDGVVIERKREDGSIAGTTVRLIDTDALEHNDFAAINQFTVIEARKNRRPDIVVFVNGLPLAVIELKNPADENATIWRAYDQLQTYKNEIPSLMRYNELLVISDGTAARIGSLTANKEWFKVWRTIDGVSEPPSTALELETLIRGVFDKRRFVELVTNFVAFEEDTDNDRVHKIIAGYHQFHAVHVAVSETVRASGMNWKTADSLGTSYARPVPDGKPGDRRIGVVWHTQGSGKSFTMLFFAALVARTPQMSNPTIVVLTDRNDLDDQLYGQFMRCHELLGQIPQQASSVSDLRTRLSVASGGVIFTTIQKFNAGEKGARMPLLSNRTNIVVVADEAHRSQYDLIDGFARNLRDALPNASFIGFTGTPIEKTDASTRMIFGEYISIYDIQRAVADNATVPIYYESRIAKLKLNEQILSQLDEEFEEITESEEATDKERLKTKWAALEALVGDPDRIAVVARDLVGHIEDRRRAINGKAMVVCMSRRICVDMYQAILSLRPDWKDQVRVVMTGSADDGPEWQQHIGTKQTRRELANSFKDPSDPFQIVIVRDMWLTGFDAPCLSTMYIDKPMQGHGLMQAIARVNRVFRDKPGGLVVDYLGLADSLKRAMATYTASGGGGKPNDVVATAISILLEKYDIACGIMHGFDWSAWKGNDARTRLALLPPAKEYVLQQENGRSRFQSVLTDMKRAYALCSASDEAKALTDDISFFESVGAGIAKERDNKSYDPDRVDAAIRQLVDKAIIADDGVIDVFTAAGLKKPDISILSDQFLAEVRGLKHKNVAAELLQKLLQDEIRTTLRNNIVESRKFSDMLQQTLNRYHNRAIETQEVIEELIRMANEMRKAIGRGEQLGLSSDELAFYDALADNDSARIVMGDDKLKFIATLLVKRVRESVTIDWQLREQARAQLRVLIKRILREHGYPPDLATDAAQLVLQQAEALCEEWV
ncbi:MAG: type I restriction endonuclease subunit R [Candidatus Kapabacteria bacterium]|nr:type I restriction endonuclease subunit R [Candidatus Kapabacteria bacterium]